MNRRLFRNPRLKLGATAAAALATLGLFGLMRAETPTRAGVSAAATAPSLGSPTPAPAGAPAIGTPAPGTLSPAARPPAGTPQIQPQLPPAPAPRPRPITRSRAS